MTEVEIRPAHADDAGELAAVYRNAYRENERLGFPAFAGSADAETVAAWIEDARIHVATAGGVIVGGVRLEATDPDRLKLSRLGVHEERKGRGNRQSAARARRTTRPGVGSLDRSAHDV
jgi:hypothetical protein